MGFMDTIKSLLTGSARRNPRAYVVDVARLVDDKNGRRLAPREQVQWLHALARVVKQEGLELQAVIESDRPLREVDSGGTYNGVTVYFAADTEQLVAQALKLCKSSGGALVSSGATMESRATEAGITVLSSGTFRKAFLPGALPNGGSRGRAGGQRGGHERRNGRARQRERNDSTRSDPPRSSRRGAAGPATPEQNGSSQEPGAGANADSSVRDLIDLVE